jgi:phosphoribosylaminoimidazole-succinocarboxamide synthase
VDPENNILTAKLVTLLGKGMPFQYKEKEWISKGVEVIARNNAVGSYLKRYPNVEKGTSLLNENGLPLVECSVKEDEAGDPIFDKSVFVGSGYVSEQDYDKVSLWTQQATNFLTDFFKSKGLALQDTKMEYGYTQEGTLVLADEISTGTSRIWHPNGTSAKDKEIFEAVVGGA